jgi:spore coat protein U-like protein
MSTQAAYCCSLGIALLAASGVAFGQTARTSIPVTANVSQSCTISTVSALAFGTYDPIGANATAPLNASGQISVACSKGAGGVTIGMDGGANAGAGGTQRAMKGTKAAGLLNYSIFQPPSTAPNAVCTYPGTIPWTLTGSGLLTLDTSPAKTARVYNVCGTIPGGQDVAVDSYTDIVGATLNF